MVYNIKLFLFLFDKNVIFYILYYEKVAIQTYQYYFHPPSALYGNLLVLYGNLF